MFLLDYWRRRCQGDVLPTRQDIDPIDFGPRLSNLFLVDVTADPPRFTVRVAGSKICWMYRVPLTGRVLDDGVAEPALQALYRRLRDVVHTRQPDLGVGNLGWCDRDYLDFEQLTVPLGDADGKVAMVLGMAVMLDPVGREH
jgi:hypothetical protein